MNELDTARMVNKCSVEICLDDSQYSLVGEGDSMQFSFMGKFDDEDESIKFLFWSSSSSKLIKLNDIAFGILDDDAFELAISFKLLNIEFEKLKLAFLGGKLTNK